MIINIIKKFKKLPKLAFYFVFAVIFTLGLSISVQSLLAAWVAPASTPPNGNAPAPLNVSSTGQAKDAGLILNHLGSSQNGLIVESGNVGIGTVSPAANLQIYGDETDAQLLIGEGKNIARGFLINKDTDSPYNAEIYWSHHPSTETGDLYFHASQDSGVLVAYKANGNVGIGMTSPTQKLEVAGNVKANQYCIGVSCVSDWATLGGDNLGNHTASSNIDLNDLQLVNARGIQFKDWDDDTGGTDNKYRILARDGAMQFFNGGVVVGSYANDTWADLADGTLIVEGNVGIGTTNPLSKLHVDGDKITLSDPSLTTIRGTIQYISGNIYITNTGTGDNRDIILTLGADSHIFKGSGNVGIGNTSPSYKLHVAGDIYANGGWLRSSGSTGWYNETYGGGWYMTDATWLKSYNDKYVQAPYFYSTTQNAYLPAGAGTSNFVTKYTGTYKVGISSIYDDGNVGIGTLAPDKNLVVAGSLSGSAGNYISQPTFRLTQVTNLSYSIGDVHSALEFYSKDSSWGEGLQAYIAAVTTRGNVSHADAGLYIGTSNGAAKASYTDPQMVIKHNGYVGIGTANPGAKLEVAGQVKITGGTPGAGKVLTSDANGLASWQAASSDTTRIWISGAGWFENGWTKIIRYTSDPFYVKGAVRNNNGVIEVRVNYDGDYDSGWVRAHAASTGGYSSAGASLVWDTGKLYLTLINYQGSTEYLCNIDLLTQAIQETGTYSDDNCTVLASW